MHTFVGRARELAALRDVVEGTAEGHFAAVLVGEPGSGKSRLLAEVLRDVPPQRVFTIEGYEAERRVPLAAASDLLRKLGATRYGSQLERLLQRHHSATDLEPLRIFEAAHQAMRGASEVLLVLDDVQWVDEMSLALAHYIIRAIGKLDRRAAIFIAARSRAAGTYLVDSLPSERIEMLELTPLTRVEGVELAQTLNPDLDPAGASALWERSGGSPFWLEVLSRGGGGVHDLSQVLTERLRGVEYDAGLVLAILAVAGRPLAMDDVGALADWPRERASNAIRALVARGVVADKGGGVRVAHDLLREAALGELPEETGRQIHSNFADLIEKKDGADVRALREALEHRRAAGLPTLGLATRLARSARRTLLGAEGLRLLGEIADEGDPQDPEVGSLQMEVASLAAELADHETAFSRWSLVSDRAETKKARASASLSASRAAYALARLDEARSYLARARSFETNDAIVDLEARTHEAAILLWLEQRTAEGRAAAIEAVATAKRIADRAGGLTNLDTRERRAYLDALRLEYETAMQERDGPGLLRAAEEREAAARGFELESQLSASLDVGVGLRQMDRVDEAVVRFRRLWTEAQRYVLPRLGVEAGWWLARTLTVLCDLPEAEEVVQKTSELATRAGDVPRARHRVARVECAVALERGDPRSPLARLEREALEEKNEHQRIAFHADSAVWRSRLDRADAAASVREQLAAGHACAKAVGCPRCAAELILCSAEALARIGDSIGARRAIAGWDRRTAAAEAWDKIVRLHALGLSKADARAQARTLASAREMAEASPYVLLALWIRLDLAEAFMRGGSDQAVPELSDLVEVARDRGALTIVELAAQRLRTLGVRTWRRGAAKELLTERERSIARLVAAGASNPEIAQRLFVSRKTVERHVSNVLKKTGARNRAELAGRVAELEIEGAHR
jgi:DNA-binding NarL/FixJ family response regulator